MSATTFGCGADYRARAVCSGSVRLRATELHDRSLAGPLLNSTECRRRRGSGRWTRESPLATYQAYLEQGELAYQWSPEANRAVFYPRVICPFTGSDRLEWRVSAGLGTVYATTVTHPREGAPYNVALIDCDEGFRLMSRVEDIAPEAVQDRHAGQVPHPPARRRRAALPGIRAAGAGLMDGLQRGSAAIVGVAKSDLGAVAAGDEPDRSDGARHPAGARRLRASI